MVGRLKAAQAPTSRPLRSRRSPAFSHRFVILVFAVTTATRLFTTSVDLVDGRPRTALGFFLRYAAFEVALLDVLGLPFLLLCVLPLIPLRHRELLPFV